VFGMDPVGVLDERVTMHTQIREAALLVYLEDQEAIWSPKKDTDG
jgi:hypothetical protein